MIDMTIPMIGLMFRSDMTDNYEYPDPQLPEGFHFEFYNGSEEQKAEWESAKKRREIRSQRKVEGF